MKNRKKLIVIAAALVALLGAIAVVDAVVRRVTDGTETSSETRMASAPTVDSVSARSPASLAAAAPTNAVGAVALSSRGTKTVRISAERTMTESLQRALAGMGARVIAPVGPRAVLAEATPAACRKIAADSRFTAEDVLPAAKIQNILADMCAKAGAANVAITIVGLAAADRAAITEFVLAKGGALKDGPQVPETFYADVPTDLVASLAERGDVRWLEYRPQMKLLNDRSVVKAAANVETVRSKHVLRGRGQVVSVYDSGFDTGDKDNCHLDFKGRVKAVVNEAYTKSDYMGHGTHCAGTVLGDGARSDGQYQGAAPEAELFAQSAGDTYGSSSIYLPGTYEHIFASVLAYGGYIQSDSWGGGAYGAYDTMCQGLDQVLWNHPELLVVVAAGNDGGKGMGTVTSPSCAKNALTVGNTYSTRWGSPENLNISSSRGPTLDGRFKPEIAAPGTYKYSTLSARSLTCTPISGNAYYTEMTGTSMATPLVAGSAALVRQWLIDRRDYTNALPSAALVKAILTGGGTMMSGYCSSVKIPQTQPNYYVGWGRLNLEETLYPTNGYAVKFADYIPFHDGVTETIDLTTTNAAPLDVQLCWYDCPADPSAAQTLINDLDLVVSNKATGAVWYGNGVDGGDHTNTTESVRIQLAAAGDYAILVRGYAVVKSSDGGKGAAAVYIRGAFPDETKEDPLYVRNARSGERYETLEQALAEVQKNDTIELLKPLDLPKALTIARSCTITVTNDDPTAALLTRADGASLTVANGAVLTLTNLVIAADDASTAVTVQAGGQLVLSGTVGVGTVAIANASGLKFAAPLDLVGDMLTVDAPNGYAKDDAFGTYTGDLLSASNAAARVINLRNDNLGGVAGGGLLTWGVIPCDPSVARCAVTIGDETTYCRSFAQALELALPQDSVLTVKKASTLSSAVQLSHNLTLAGDGGSLAFDAAEAGFVVPTGTAMVLTNVTVSGAGAKLKDCAFKVMGGSLTLESGATLRNFTDVDEYNSKNYGGTVVVVSGSVTMKSGAVIANCAAHGGGCGGAIYVGGTANLLGGTITGCSAAKGGAVYVWGNATKGAKLNLAGDFVAKDNAGTQYATDNVFLAYRASLSFAGDLTPELAKASPRIGLNFGTKDGLPDKNAEGSNFVVTASSAFTAYSPESTALHFFSDINHELHGTSRTDGSDVTFFWTRNVSDGTCEKPEANVFVKDPATGTLTLFYKDLNIAHKYLDWDATFYLKDSIRLTNTVTIAKAVRFEPYDSDVTPVVYRFRNAMYKVTGSLTVSNVELWGRYGMKPSQNNSTVGLVSVDGGSLTLEEGAVVGHVDGAASRAANAITVFNGGTVTMKSGSRVMEVDNEYWDEYEVSCGGGILLDHATGRFEGGAIYNCKAYRAGGLYVANGSTAYISGDFYAYCNYSYKRESAEGPGAPDNIVVSENSKLVLAGLLASADPESEDPEDPDPGFIGVNEGMSSDSNCFATVDWEWTDFEELQGCAAQFAHDIRKYAEPVYDPYWECWDDTVYGTAVTNWNEKTQRWDARLVWGDSLSSTYGITIDGETYRGAIPAGMSVATPTAFSVTPTTGANGQQVLKLDGGVEGCWYTVYSTEDLAQPFAKEASVQLKAGETFEYEVDQTAGAKFYKVVAEEGLK